MNFKHIKQRYTVSEGGEIISLKNNNEFPIINYYFINNNNFRSDDELRLSLIHI